MSEPDAHVDERRADGGLQGVGDQRLYGVPGAEHLHFDPADCYSTDIEPWLDEHDTRPRLIEEWSVRHPVSHLPDAESIAEWMAEHASEQEVDENAAEEFYVAHKQPDVLEAAETLREAMAAHVRYRMADKHLRTLTVTFDADGDPLLDGVPMYVPNAEVRRGALRALGLAEPCGHETARGPCRLTKDHEEAHRGR